MQASTIDVAISLGPELTAQLADEVVRTEPPDVPVVALAPGSVASGLADGVVAVPLREPGDVLETRLLWRGDDRSPTVDAFRSVARAAY